MILNSNGQTDIRRKITSYYKNGTMNDPYFNYFSSPADAIPRLNQTELEGYTSVHWPTTTTATDGVLYEEHIMRVLHGRQLANVTRLNIQLRLQDLINITTITFNVLLASSVTDESAEVSYTDAVIQPTSISDPLPATPDPSRSSTQSQISACSTAGTDSNLKPHSDCTCTSSVPLDSTSKDVNVPSPTPVPTSSKSRQPPHRTPSSSDLRPTGIPPTSSSQAATIGSSVSVVIFLVVVVTVVIPAIVYVTYRKTQNPKNTPVELLHHGNQFTSENGNSSANTSPSEDAGNTDTVITNPQT